MQVCMGLGVMGLLLAAIASSPGWLWLAGRFGKYKVGSALPAICKLCMQCWLQHDVRYQHPCKQSLESRVVQL